MSRVVGWLFCAILLASSLVAISPAALGQECSVLVQSAYSDYGPAMYARDADCDGVIDDIDNCPSTNNADQYDADRDGTGDVCDSRIEQIIVNPDNHLRQGEFAHITVRLLNNRAWPMRDITLVARNEQLDIESTSSIPYIPAGEMATADFWLKIPKCATPGTYDISIGASFPEGDRVTSDAQRERIFVDKSDACGTPSGALDDTIIAVRDQIDAAQGEHLLIPITITNMGETSASYELAIKDIGTLGTWRVDPAARMTLSGGSQDTAILSIDLNNNAGAGTHALTLTVTSDNQATRVPLRVFIRVPTNDAQQGGPRNGIPAVIVLQTVLLLAVIILIIVAIIIAVRHNKKRRGSSRGEYATPSSAPSRDDEDSGRMKNTTKQSKRTVAVEETDDEKMETYY